MYEVHTIVYNSKPLRVGISKIYESDQVIRYQVTGKNGSLVFQSDEPLLVKAGFKHRRPVWKLIKGHIPDPTFCENIIYLLNYIRKQEK